MISYKDFSNIYEVTPRTIYTKIKAILPILKGFQTQKRKRLFTIEEAKCVIHHIGLPKENTFNRRLKEIYPDLY
jgi:hypothetical protein